MPVVRLRSGIRVRKPTNKVPEWLVQASIIRALRAMPEFDKRFTLAGDMAAAKRSPQTAVKMKATGLVSGEPDVRIYLEYGRLCLIEVKTDDGRESPEQIDRIALLDNLGFTVEVIQTSCELEAAQRAVSLVRGWLAANDNGEKG